MSWKTKNNTLNKSKLASRKLWMAISGLLTVILVEMIGIDASAADAIERAITIIVPAYIGGQSIVDAFSAWISRDK